MLGFFILCIIGLKFYDLAKAHLKNKWLYGIAGLTSYFIGTIIVTLFSEFAVDGSGNKMYDSSGSTETIVSIIFGFFICYTFYKTIQAKWEEEKMESQSNVLDSELVPIK